MLKTKSMVMITLTDTAVDDGNLLVNSSASRLDIVKDLIPSLPNVLVLKIATPNISKFNANNDGKQSNYECIIYHTFEIHDTSKLLFELVLLVKRSFDKDGMSLPTETKYVFNLPNRNYAYANSILQMIKNYYKDDSRAYIEDCTFMVPELMGEIAAKMNLEIDKMGDPLKQTFIRDDSEIQLKSDSLAKQFIEYFKTKYCVPIMTDIVNVTTPYEDRDDMVRKTTNEVYDIYPLDSNHGKVMTMTVETYADYDLKDVRISQITSEVSVSCPKDNRYGFSLMADIMLEFEKHHIRNFKPDLPTPEELWEKEKSKGYDGPTIEELMKEAKSLGILNIEAD